ncbi:hypothetical protein [Sporofaciens musculi]|uniref:hypothetical protein n=1 Tax=Sporofaciens musculi TaxID=2681861 RepID=UPI0025A1A4A0|nr:hypothetical protein [Sporofaciens musculi]
MDYKVSAMLRLREPFSRKVRLHIRQQLLQQLWDKYVPSASAEYERIRLIYLGEKDGQETGQARRVQLLVKLVLHNRMIRAGLSGSPVKTIAGQKPMENNLRRLEKCFLTQLRCCNLTLYRNVSRTITLLRQAEEDGRRFKSWQKENQTIERQWKEYRLCSAFCSDMENFLTEYSAQTARTLEKELLLAMTEREYGLLAKKLDNMAESKEFMLQYIDVMGEEEIRRLWLQMEGLAQQEGSLVVDFGDGQADSIFREKFSEVQKRYEREVVRGFFEQASFINNENFYRMPDDMEKLSEEKTYRLSDIMQMIEDVQRRLFDQKERIKRREVLAFETYRELYQEALNLEDVVSQKDKRQRYKSLDSVRAVSQSQEDIIWLVEERYRKQRQGEMSQEELKNICEYGRMFIKLLNSFPEQQNDKLDLLFKEINRQMEMKGQGLEAFSVEWRENDLQDPLKEQRSREMLEQLFELSEDKRTEFIRNLADVIHIWYQVGTSLQAAEPETVKGRFLPETTRLEDVSVQELWEWGEALMDVDMAFLDEKKEPISEEKIIYIIDALRAFSISQGLHGEEQRDREEEQAGEKEVDFPLVLSEVMRLQRTLSFSEGTNEEAGQSATESENQEVSLPDRTKRDEASPQRLWEWAGALLFYPKTAASLDATTIDERSQTDIIRRQIEISKDRNNLRQLINQITHVLSVEADIEGISQLDYAEGQAGTPTVQNLLRYIQTLDEKQYGVLVRKLSQVIKVQSMLSHSDGLREEAVGGPEQKDFYQKLWEWGKALLSYPKAAASLDEEMISEAKNQESGIFLNDGINEVMLSAEDRNHEIPQTEVILRQIKISKDRSNLRRLISQINHTLSLESDTEKLVQLDYAEGQVEMPMIQNLLHHIQTLDEEKYGVLVKELSQVTKIQSSKAGEWGEALLDAPDVPEHRQEWKKAYEASGSVQSADLEYTGKKDSDRDYLQQMIHKLNHMALLPGTSEVQKISELNDGEDIKKVRDGYAGRSGWLLHKGDQLKQPQVQNLLSYIHGLDKEQYRILVEELTQITSIQKKLSAEEEKAYPDVLKQVRTEQEPPVSTYLELSQRIWQYETGRRQTELLNTKLTGADMVIPIEAFASMDIASEPDKALPERKLRAFQIGYPASELAYTVQNPDTSREDHQRTEMRLQEENTQIKSAQEQLGRKLTEVEKQLRGFEGAAKARQDVRSLADQVKRQLYEELHVEKLRRGLI